MRPSIALIACVASSLGLAIACGGITTQTTPGTADAAPAPIPSASSPVDAPNTSVKGDASPSSTDGALASDGPIDRDSGAGFACQSESDCNGGSCYQGVCMCAAGKWIQPNGRCAVTPPPSCDDQGGWCVRNAVAGQECASGTAIKHFTGGCGEAPSNFCCTDITLCRGAATVQNCYVNGTDAAYTPRCVNGWMTCDPGDSPELQIR